MGEDGKSFTEEVGNKGRKVFAETETKPVQPEELGRNVSMETKLA